MISIFCNMHNSPCSSKFMQIILNRMFLKIMAWLSLFYIIICVNLLDLVAVEYKFGRGEMCDVQFNTPEMISNPCFQVSNIPKYNVIYDWLQNCCHINLCFRISLILFSFCKIVSISY